MTIANLKKANAHSNGGNFQRSPRLLGLSIDEYDARWVLYCRVGLGGVPGVGLFPELLFPELGVSFYVVQSRGSPSVLQSAISVTLQQTNELIELTKCRC